MSPRLLQPTHVLTPTLLFAALVACGSGGGSNDGVGSGGQAHAGSTSSASGGNSPSGGVSSLTGGQSSGQSGGARGGSTNGFGGRVSGVTGGTFNTTGGTNASSGRGGASGGVSASGGAASSPGSGGAANLAGSAGSSGLSKFSFFVTSLGAMQRLSNSTQGFGGDLRYGETGEGAGLRGADKICTEIAEASMRGSSVKVWRAFLSATTGGTTGGAVNAKDRIGTGPWYDRGGRLVASGLAGLLKTRPDGDAAVVNDLPNENGIPNHFDGAPGCTGNSCPDNHDILTGSDTSGALYTRGTNPTCSDWTTAEGKAGRPRCGHSWPRGTQSWVSILDEAGCAAGASLVESGGPDLSNPTVGSGGGYGAIYCFALAP